MSARYWAQLVSGDGRDLGTAVPGGGGQVPARNAAASVPGSQGLGEPALMGTARRTPVCPLHTPCAQASHRASRRGLGLGEVRGKGKTSAVKTPLSHHPGCQTLFCSILDKLSGLFISKFLQR